jgi:MYXO-CTERM domain-containing protein
MRWRPFAWCLASVLLTPAFAGAQLRIHPENPHYFQEAATGEPVLITSYTNIVTVTPAWDYALDVQLTAGWGFHYARVWHFGGCDVCELPFALTAEVAPCQDDYEAPCNDGVTDPRDDDYKVDLDVWNPVYWTRLRDAMARARDAEIYAEIHLFNGCEFSPAGCDRWGDSPWASDNNVNDLETPTCDGEGVPDVYDFAGSPNLAYYQERWIRELIDRTIEYPNIIYEVENEHRGNPSSAFGDHYGQFIKDHIASTYPGQSRLVSYSSIDSDLEEFYALSSVDIVNRHYGGEPESDPSLLNDYLESRWTYGKPINIDEFANGLGDPDVLREMCWTIVTSGGHFHIEDALPEAEPLETVQIIERFKHASGWDFVHASPERGVIVDGGGYCMTQPGVEYLCYHPTGGTKTLALNAGTYTARFWNPRTGGYATADQFTHGGGTRVFVAPDANDWVLHVRRDPLPRTVLRAGAAPVLTIDGDSADWDIAPGAPLSRGGEVEEGDVAFVGFEGVRYFAAGHLKGGQYPPQDGGDHTARIFARHDRGTLYFLAEIEDADVEAAAPVDENWRNDGFEIYLDPGHEGGAGALADSSSAVQLVVDAAGRVNAYQLTAEYRTRVLAAVSAAAVPRTASGAPGYTIEVAVDKGGLLPAPPEGAGVLGVDFVVHDSDEDGAASRSTFASWCDPTISTGFPSKVPDHWGDLLLGDPTWVPADDEDVAGDGAVDGGGEVVDGGGEGVDGGADDAGGVDGGGTGSAGGCSCATGGGGSPAWLFGVLGLLVRAGLVRRRGGKGGRSGCR